MITKFDPTKIFRANNFLIDNKRINVYLYVYHTVAVYTIMIGYIDGPMPITVDSNEMFVAASVLENGGLSVG